MLTPLRCTVRWRLVAVDSPSFPAASPEDKTPKILSTPSSKTRKTSCWSCRKNPTEASFTLWSSLIHPSPTLILESWSTAFPFTLDQWTISWKITSCLASFQHWRHKITFTKASNPMGIQSNIKIATKAVTVILRFCQTTIFKPQAHITATTCFTKAPVSLWTGVPRQFQSPILTAWCQTSSSCWRSCILEAVAATLLATVGRMASMLPPLEFAKNAV